MMETYLDVQWNLIIVVSGKEVEDMKKSVNESESDSDNDFENQDIYLLNESVLLWSVSWKSRVYRFQLYRLEYRQCRTQP
jgi:hypothetical protein